MRNFVVAASLACSMLVSAASAQNVVLSHQDHEIMLASSDPKLAANKRLVYDFWREVLEAKHLELADKYLDTLYIQHNPNVTTGREGFVAYFSHFGQPQPIEPRVKSPLVAIVAEGDLVVLSFVRRAKDLKNPEAYYTTTWFDMFRIENGKIAEHWDPAPKN